MFPTWEILTLYLERLHSNSIFVLLFHNINEFGHELVSYIIDVSATLRGRGQGPGTEATKTHKTINTYLKL